MSDPPWPLGATWLGGSHTRFVVWAPFASAVDLVVEGSPATVPMDPAHRGYFVATVEGAPPGTRYRYRLDGDEGRTFPDPASRSQPGGVHAPSAVVDMSFDWSDSGWHGLPLQEYVIYELHTGLFSQKGTFDGAIARLPYLRDLGITAIELMPVAQFPGTRNWGYDGASPFAPQDSYGGPEGLHRLVDAAHRHGIAVVLDVVYNHLGPEGNYLGRFGPYFTDRYHTPWGSAINFEGHGADEVRRYFIENALMWVTDYHIDALRLDAVHAIFDASAMPFLAELAGAIHSRAAKLHRHIYLIAESDLNAPRFVRSQERGGYGLDAQWSDDYHHALHALLTGERQGYYEDFGRVEHLARALGHGYTYAGQYSTYRGARHGGSLGTIPGTSIVVCAQNHDQVGNRMLGDRLASLVPFESLKLAAGAVLLSPFVPLVFMGEEYGETAPFQYFVSHSDPALVEAVRRGRTAEFAAHRWEGEPPDPQAVETFEACRPRFDRATEGHHALLLEFYRELLRIRRQHPALPAHTTDDIDVQFDESQRTMTYRVRGAGSADLLALANFAETPATMRIPFAGEATMLIDSADPRWGGPGLPSSIDEPRPPRSFVAFTLEQPA
ncbi:MAG: malto-oligosyltrehalose trehalohydrolase [Dehalococcoidia bacterium]